MNIPNFEDVVAAHERIKPYIHQTPVLTSSYLNELTGAKLFFKCENLQKAGAFKVRGAANAVFGLDDARPGEETEFAAVWINRCNGCIIDSLLINTIYNK